MVLYPDKLKCRGHIKMPGCMEPRLELKDSASAFHKGIIIVEEIIKRNTKFTLMKVARPIVIFGFIDMPSF
jgi:hypothetical protein